MDLSQINHLFKNDYNQHNHPVTTIANIAQHMAGKKYFFKLDCSQAYHCSQMSDEQLVRTTAEIQLRKPHFCIQQYSTRLRGCTREGWHMCSVCRWDWHRCKQHRRSTVENRGGLPANPESRSQAVDVQVCARTPTIWLPRTKHHHNRSSTT